MSFLSISVGDWPLYNFYSVYSETSVVLRLSPCLPATNLYDVYRNEKQEREMVKKDATKLYKTDDTGTEIQSNHKQNFNRI